MVGSELSSLTAVCRYEHAVNCRTQAQNGFCDNLPHDSLTLIEF